MIGVFDSGIGGLTVVRELRKALPRSRIVYFGDVARMPFGNKSAATVTQYAREIGAYLIGRGARSLVIACNTASAVAAETLRRELEVPVFDVISPAVRAASRPGVRRVAVLGTRATIASGAYQRALAKFGRFRVEAIACPMFVPIVEEGFAGTPEGRAIVRRTLRSLANDPPDVAILACTHYPLLRRAIAAALPGVPLVDSRAVAEDVRASSTDAGGPSLEIVVTDRTPHFVRFANRIMGQPVACVVIPHETLSAPQPARAGGPPSRRRRSARSRR